MKLARVVGTVVSTVKSPIFEDRAMLLVDLIDPDGREAGGYLLAVDTVGAGAGETVLVLDEGTSARQIVGVTTGGPLRTVIVGIVDHVEGPAALAPARSAEKPGPSAGDADGPGSGTGNASARARRARRTAR